MNLQGKIAVVTGGSRGIGRGLVEALLKQGASRVLNGRSAEKGQQAIEDLNAGERAHFVSGDVTQRAACERLIDAAVERYGGLHILINNVSGNYESAYSG